MQKLLTHTIIALVAVTLLAGCATEKKQRQRALTYLVTHPQDAAAYCATAFPPRDSIGQPRVIKPADNKNYTGQIDSLGAQVDSLQNKLRQDSIKLAAGGSISGQELSKYKKQVSTLQNSYNALKRSYRPCETETVEIPVYRANTAKERELQLEIYATNDRVNKVEQEKKDLELERDKAKQTGKDRLWMLIGAGGLGIIYVLLKIKGIIKF